MFRNSYIFAAFLLAAFAAQMIFSVDAEARAKAPAGPYKVSAKSAVLLDGRKVLYEKHVDQKVVPASTTKVMTALLVLERLDLDEIVTVSSQPPRVLPSKIDIKPGEKYKVRELLYALLLSSANDAAVALAEAVAGTEEEFVDMMNSRATQLGARNTQFANSHGLPDDKDQYTTARDMILIFQAALKHEFFVSAIRYKFRTIYSELGRKISLRSHNKALFKGWKENIYGKTGYTRAAKACFVGYVEKNKRTLFIAVFGCSKRWDDVEFIIEKSGGIKL